MSYRITFDCIGESSFLDVKVRCNISKTVQTAWLRFSGSSLSSDLDDMVRVGSSIIVTNLKFGRSFTGSDVILSPNTGFKIKKSVLPKKVLVPEKYNRQQSNLRGEVWPREIDVGRAFILFWEIKTRDSLIIYMLTPSAETLIVQYFIPKAVQFVKKLCWLKVGCDVEICRLLVKSYDSRNDILLGERIDHTFVVESLGNSTLSSLNKSSFNNYVADEKRRIHALEIGKRYFNRVMSCRSIQSCDRQFIPKVTLSIISQTIGVGLGSSEMICVIRTAYDAVIAIVEDSFLTSSLNDFIKVHTGSEISCCYDESLLVDLVTCIEWMDEDHMKTIIPSSVYSIYLNFQPSTLNSGTVMDSGDSSFVNEGQECSVVTSTSMVCIHRILACSRVSAFLDNGEK